jgi:MFS transporter, DHA2 family, methylenomycin A resistance protein
VFAAASAACGLAPALGVLLTAAGNLAGGRDAGRFTLRARLAAGQALMAAGLVILCLAAPAAPDWLLMMLMIRSGPAAALAVPSVTALLLATTAAGLLPARPVRDASASHER